MGNPLMPFLAAFLPGFEATKRMMVVLIPVVAQVAAQLLRMPSRTMKTKFLPVILKTYKNTLQSTPMLRF